MPEYDVALRACEHWNAEKTLPLSGKLDLRQSHFCEITQGLEIEIPELVKRRRFLIRHEESA